MIISEEFANKAQQEAEEKSFTSIRKFGLMRYAEESHERFMKSIDIEPTRVTRNAYLLQFNYVMEEFGAIAPAHIDELVEEASMRVTRIMHEYGDGYITASSSLKGVSDDLYTASMASSVVRRNPDEKLHGALIGEDPFTLITVADQLSEEHGRLFQKVYTGVECKALHLAHTAEDMEKILDQSDAQIRRNGAIDVKVANFAQRLIGDIGGLGLHPKRSELEGKIVEYAKEIQERLQTNPIAGSNVVYSFSHHEPPEDDEPSNE